MILKTSLAGLLLSACLMPPRGTSTGPSSTTSSSPPPHASSGFDDSAAAPSASSTPAPAGPQTVSVTIRSSCSKTAKVFYGDKPGFSSGTQSSISSNSVQSKTFRVGDQMWVLDDSGKALGSVRIDAGTRQLEIDSSCSSIRG